MSSENDPISCDTETTEKRNCDHITKPSSTVARIVATGEACPLCGKTL